MRGVRTRYVIVRDSPRLENFEVIAFTPEIYHVIRYTIIVLRVSSMIRAVITNSQDSYNKPLYKCVVFVPYICICMTLYVLFGTVCVLRSERVSIFVMVGHFLTFSSLKKEESEETTRNSMKVFEI